MEIQFLSKKYTNNINEDLNRCFLVHVKDANEVECHSKRESCPLHHPFVKRKKLGKYCRALIEATNFHDQSLTRSLLTRSDIL